MHPILALSIFATLGVLGIVCLTARMSKKSKPAIPISCVLILAAVSPLFICIVLLPILYQAVILGVLQLLFLIPGRGRKLYFRAAPLGTILAWILAMAWSFYIHPDFRDLRAKYPEEPLDQRLPQKQPDSPSKETEPGIELAVKSHDHPLKANDAKLNHLEHDVEEQEPSERIRYLMLKRLHETKVDEFVQQPGFGVGRMLRPVTPTEQNLAPKRRDTIVPQPGASEPNRYLKSVTLDFDVLHRSAILDFINPEGWGLVNEKDRRVIGFIPHGMSKIPTDPDWRVIAIDLIGLVVHEKPTAYVSANLPRMDELRKAPTRPLDAFEDAGLVELRTGKHEFVQDVNGRVRMLGAIRSTKQCIQCHGGARGDLLGAFSYTLQPGK